MKKFKTYLILAAIAIAFVGCSPKNGKITEIPITTASADAKATLQQGIALFDQQDFQQARAMFIKAISQDPKLALAYIFKAITNESPKEFADDLNNAKANIDGASDYEKMYYELASTYATDDYNKRVEIANKIATTYPDAARAQSDLGNTYMGGVDDSKARACFQKATQINPNWTGGYVGLVNSYVFSEPKDFQQAEQNAQKVVQLAPTSCGAEVALGDCYRAENSLEKARDAYGKAITLDPNVAESYYKKGHANTFLGNYDEARQNYTDGATHDDNKFNAIQYIATTYIYAGDDEKALTYLTDQLSKLDASGETPNKIAAAKLNLLDASANIAMQSGDAGKLKEVITAMQPISDQMGNDMGTDEAKATQKATMLYWQSISATLDGNYDAAKTTAEQIKTTLDAVKDPNKLNNYYFALGFMDMKQKNYNDAVTAFEKTTPTVTYNQYWLAMADLGAGNKDKAGALLKEVSNYNFNEVGYALVRNDAKSTLASL
jgi:tetratricopeptide (TPR) repeat protein